MLVTGPLVLAVGVPFSFLGNAAWRDNCGPTNSNTACAAGSTASGAAHTMAGLAYGTGILLTGLGGSRLGHYNGHRAPERDGRPFVIGGGVLLPVSLIGMGMTRLFLFLPAPECETYGCVQQLQTISSIAVPTLALTASAGAGMLLYGLALDKHDPPSYRASLTPQFGRGFTGLSLTGQF